MPTRYVKMEIVVEKVAADGKKVRSFEVLTIPVIKRVACNLCGCTTTNRKTRICSVCQVLPFIVVEDHTKEKERKQRKRRKEASIKYCCTDCHQFKRAGTPCPKA